MLRWILCELYILHVKMWKRYMQYFLKMEFQFARSVFGFKLINACLDGPLMYKKYNHW